MTVNGLPNDEALELSVAQSVDRLCNQFEAAWKASAAGGPPPRIEDLLAQTPEALRAALLPELIALEIYYLQARGEHCQATDYQQRFPGLAPEWLAGALTGAQPVKPGRPSVSADKPRQTASEIGLQSTEAYVPPPTTEGIGSRIGPYKLLQKLGEGGMGSVYVAEQEHPVTRRVAVKIIKAGMDSAQVIARFEQERQALALMDHPNIAKVLDAGTTNTSRPFFVMELVKGIPITKFCDHEHLTPRERLELFIPVCHAVQHAHQKGIIHRDLKPSNVIIALYDGKPVPKVIDFGVSKATSQKLTERTLFTEVGQMVGTLEYMAPEQAELNNLDIDTRADIYALGVILYELLTGGPPFTGQELRSVAFTQMLRMIREVEPQKPSTKLSSSEQLASIAAKRKLEPAKLTKLVSGDLDWIVMKALEKDRSRRYDTANALALEIQRFLHDEPVLARPPGAGYRLRKFVRRHPASTALALVSSVAALALVGLAVAQFYNSRLASTNVQLQETSDHLAVANIQLQDTSNHLAATNTQLKDTADHLSAANIQLGESSEKLKKALQDAQLERTWARRYLYVAQLTLAERARQEGQIGRMMQLLRSVIPESREQEDLRGFEWHHLWRLHHGEQSRLRGHTEAVTAVAFGSDDRLLASGSADKTVKLWDAVTGKEVRSLRGHEKSVTCLAFSPDCNRLVSGSADSTVKIWDTATGRELYSLKGHTDSVTAVAYSPDGRHVLSGCADRMVWVWDPDAGRTIAEYKGHTEPINGIAISPDGKTVASVSGSRNGSARAGEAALWTAMTGKEELRLEGGHAFTSVAFSPDGKHLATGELLPGAGSRDAPPAPVLKMYDLASPRTAFASRQHTGVITSLGFSPNGKQLVSASLDQTVRIWDVAAKKEASVLHEEAGVLTVAISADGRRIAAGSEDRTVKLWAPPDSGVLTLSGRGTQNNVVFSPVGRRVAASSGGTVTVWDLRTESELKKIRAGGYQRVAWSPDGWSLGVEGRLVDPLTGENSLDLGLTNQHGAAFSPDGKLFATAGSYSGLCVWDRSTGACLNKFHVPRFASCVAFSPDGKWLAGGSGTQARGWGGENGSLNVWDLKTGNPVPTFNMKTISVWGVAFSPDGKRLAAATGYYNSKEPGDVHVWDTTTGRELYLLKGHADCAWSVAFSPDGRRLVSASGGRNLGRAAGALGEVKIWDMITGLELWTLRGHASTVYGAAFSPCGRRLATASADGTVKIWDGTPLAETAPDQPLADER
jgi:WD40 repeat protein